MIIYNMRERGPLEYDKFVYNIFQFCNYVKYYKKDIDSEYFNGLVENFNNLYNNILSKTNDIYMNALVYEET